MSTYRCIAYPHFRTLGSFKSKAQAREWAMTFRTLERFEIYNDTGTLLDIFEHVSNPDHRRWIRVGP